MHIENGFKPQTVNEIILLNRIRDLKLEMAGAGRYSGDYVYDFGYNMSEVRELRLPLIAEVSSQPTQYGDNIEIVGRAQKGEQIAFRHFANLTPNKHINIQILEQLHNQLIHRLAAEWAK